MRWRWGMGAIGCAAVVLHCSSGSTSRDSSVELPERGGPPGADAGGDALSTVSRDGAPSSACDPARPFGAPSPIAGFDPSTFAATPRLSHDELTIYFTTHVEAGAPSRLAKAARGSRSEAFGSPELLTSLSSAVNDNDPTVSDDGLSIWFHSARAGNADLYTATRASTAASFGSPMPVTEVNTAGPEAHAYYRQSGLELWFVADRDAGYDIYRATRAGNVFSAGAVVPELSSPQQDWQPMVTEDGLTALIASTRPGGPGGFDLFLARRASTAQSFGVPEPVAAANSADQEFAGWISPDGCRLYFSSDREAPGVRQRLYVSERPK